MDNDWACAVDRFSARVGASARSFLPELGGRDPPPISLFGGYRRYLKGKGIVMSFYRDFTDKIAIEAWNRVERAAYHAIGVSRLAPALGAEISGIDLCDDLAPEQFAELRRALDENLVLILRGQRMEREDHKRLARRFGSLHRHELSASKTIAGAYPDPEFLSWKTGKESRFAAGDGWHSDVSCDPTPITYSFLRVTKMPPLGGDTAFANMHLAYESLSDPMKAMLEGLTAIHDGANAWTAGYGSKPEPGKAFPVTEHPVIARHHRTGRKFLYVNPSFTTHIVQLTRDESDGLLAILYRHIERNLAFQARVHWSDGALVIWDNWAVQHHAIWDYYPAERWGDRVSVVSDQAPRR